MGSSAPASPDFKGAAEATGASSAKNTAAQTEANRPNQNNGMASSQWTQGPDGQWSQNTTMQGGLGTAQGGLMGQASGLANGMDWSQFGQVGTGDAAREQAINASYNQAASRLNPQWEQRGQQMTSSLANSGLDPNSQAARNAQRQFSQGRNDAYSGAMNSAIQNGNQAQAMTFGQNMQSRQQAIMEALRARGMPLDELKQLQGLSQQSGFQGAQSAEATNYLGASAMQGQYDMNAWEAENRADADKINGITKVAGTIIPVAAMASDERAKTDIVRHDVDLYPGVPLATWTYRPEFGGQKGAGVIAQDLLKVAPQFVGATADGVLFVDYAGLRGAK